MTIAAWSISPCVALAATTWPVTSCLDNGGAETLRARVTNAVTGDTIDMSGLACATIALATGGTHIAVAQDSLTIVGPAATTLTIDGSALATGATYDSNIFDHTGTGTLTVSHVTLSGGHVKKTSGSSTGGCVRSAHDVALTYVTVTGCHAYSGVNLALGGGVYAAHDLTLTHSTISNDKAKSGVGGMARGGGVHSGHGLVMQASTISGNEANGTIGTGGGISLNAAGTTLSMTSSSIVGNHAAGPNGRGGAMYGAGVTVTITASTISGNTADRNGGGIYFMANPHAGSSVDVVNSTISGNHAVNLDGGMYTDYVETVHISNTTIAFNSAGVGYPGLYLVGPSAVTLQSTLIANNSGSGGDLATWDAVTFNADLVGDANNLIFATAATGLPSDTLFGVCPLLGPLRANGGPTQTRALWTGSPAIDTGNVNGLPPATTTDQRGSPYLRVSGAAADIGAYEVQQDDIVFGGGFDGC